MRKKKGELFEIQRRFNEAGFNFEEEFMRALELVDPRTKLEALVAMAPYFMARIPQIKPIEPEDPKKQIEATKPARLEQASSDELMKLLSSGKYPNSTNNG